MYHENPLILVTDYKISSVEEILPVLEMVARENRPLIIVAEDVEGQALAAMIMNAVRGSLKIAAIKAPYYGEERRDTLEDLSLSVGATFISRESGVKLSEVRMSHLGTAKSIESNKYSTVIVGGVCDYEQIETKIEALKNEIKQTESLSICESIQGRVVRLSSGVAVIHVGGTTEVEMTERKHRIEDALEAVKSAQREGILAGGGVSLVRASQKLKLKTEGAHIVREAILEPVRQMARNAGDSPDVVVEKICKSKGSRGWNFAKGKMMDMFDEGVVDPFKVTRCALQNASSAASTLITTNHAIIKGGT